MKGLATKKTLFSSENRVRKKKKKKRKWEDFGEKMGREDLGVENPILRVRRLKTDI